MATEAARTAPNDASQSSKSGGGGFLSVKIIAAALFVATVVLVALQYKGPSEWIELAIENVNNLKQVLLDAGYWGPVIIFCLYLVTTVFMLPLWGFHVTCGYVYGTFWSALLISVTQAVCAGAAFLASRYVARPFIKKHLEAYFGKKYHAIDKAVGKEGFKIILLLRLSPIIPFGINNYICGCTEMRFWDFVIGTWLGILPGTTAYCNLGAIGESAVADGTTIFQKFLMGLGFVAAIGVVWYLQKLSKKALQEIDEDFADGKDIDKKKINELLARSSLYSTVLVGRVIYTAYPDQDNSSPLANADSKTSVLVQQK